MKVVERLSMWLEWAQVRKTNFLVTEGQSSVFKYKLNFTLHSEFIYIYS